jgi:hypothetical protein
MTDLQQAILEFEAQWWHHAGNKERAIVRTFKMSVIRYNQRLNQIIDTDEALQFDPLLVNRLRRIRSERVRARTQRRNLA